MPRFVRRLIDRNPFLMVSAALVLAGGYLVAAGAGSATRLLGLFAIIQLYELALLGGAGFIERFVGPRDRAARRDVQSLLALEVLFLGDLSFTNSVFPGTGVVFGELGVEREDLVAPILAAVLAIALGPFKLWLAGKAGRIEWPRALYGYALFALALIHGGPVLVLLFGEAANATGAIGTLWWLVAFLPLVLTRAVAAGEGRMGAFEEVEVAVLRTTFRVSRPTGVLVLGVTLLVAAVGHIISASWAHVVSFEAWQPAGLLLGLAAAWPRLVPQRARALSTAGLSLGAASLALLLATGAPSGERLFLGPFETTPFRGVAILATLALIDAARKTGRPRLLYAALGAAVLAALGATPREVDATLVMPATSTKVLFTAIAAALTIIKVDHPIAALAGFAAAGVLDGGSIQNGWLVASLVCLHQLVLAHRHRSAPGLRLRTLFAWGALLCGFEAIRPELSALDLYVVALVGGAVWARARGFGRGYEWPAALTSALLAGDRLIRFAPRERGGVGVLALAGGVAFLVAGLAWSIFRQRLASWVDEEPRPV